MDVFRTLIIRAQDAPIAQRIAATLGGQASTGMWTTMLSPDGNEPATHAVSTGYIAEGFAQLAPYQVWVINEDGDWVLISSDPGQIDTVVAMYNQADPDNPITNADVEQVFENADVTEQPPFVAFDRLGIKIIYPPFV